MLKEDIIDSNCFWKFGASIWALFLPPYSLKDFG